MAEPTATVLRQSSLSLVYCRQVMSGQVSLPCSGRQSGTPRYILSECFIRVHCSRKRHSPNTKTLAILDSPIKSLNKRHQGVKRSISQYQHKSHSSQMVLLLWVEPCTCNLFYTIFFHSFQARVSNNSIQVHRSNLEHLPSVPPAQLLTAFCLMTKHFCLMCKKRSAS